MIDIKVGSHYQIIGTKGEYDTEDNSTIEIKKIRNRGLFEYEYLVLAGKVVGNTPGPNIYTFWEGSWLHEHCVHVYDPPVKQPLRSSDLKPGDYIISEEPYSKAYQVSEEHLYLLSHGIVGLKGCRLATQDEIAAVQDDKVCKEAYKAGDIVVCIHAGTNLVLNKMYTVTECNHTSVIFGRFGDSQYPVDWFRPATKMETKAYKEGHAYFHVWKDKMEREAMKRYPSPASYVDVFGYTYKGVYYERPIWDGDHLRLKENHGVIYCHDQWATPIVSTAAKVSTNPGNNIKLYNEMVITKDEFEKSLKEYKNPETIVMDDRVVRDHWMDYIMEKRPQNVQPKVVGKGFDEKEFLQNPINRKMPIPFIKRKRDRNIHHYITF